MMESLCHSAELWMDCWDEARWAARVPWLNYGCLWPWSNPFQRDTKQGAPFHNLVTLLTERIIAHLWKLAAHRFHDNSAVGFGWFPDHHRCIFSWFTWSCCTRTCTLKIGFWSCNLRFLTDAYLAPSAGPRTKRMWQFKALRCWRWLWLSRLCNLLLKDIRPKCWRDSHLLMSRIILRIPSRFGLTWTSTIWSALSHALHPSVFSCALQVLRLIHPACTVKFAEIARAHFVQEQL